MASITVRNLEDGLKHRLRIRAAENGRSMEEEARDILRNGDLSPATRTGEPGECHSRQIRAPRRRRTGHPSPFTHAQTAPVRLRQLR